MKNNSPQKQAAISWIILMIGILLAVIGAMTAKEYLSLIHISEPTRP
mgnify:CR=1 FL=1